VEVEQHGRRHDRGCGQPVGQHGMVIVFFRHGSHADTGFFRQHGSGGGEQRIGHDGFNAGRPLQGTGHGVGQVDLQGVGQVVLQGVGHGVGQVGLQGVGQVGLQGIGHGTGQVDLQGVGQWLGHAIGAAIMEPMHHTRALTINTASVRPS